MTRLRIVVLTATAVLVISTATTDNPAAWIRGAYSSLTLVCMSLTGALKAHPYLVAMTLAGAVVGILAIALISATIRVRCTSRIVRSLTLSGIVRLSPRVGALSKRLRIVDRIDLVKSQEPFAITHGLLKPRLLLSSGLVALLDDQQLEAVLRHESAHIHGLDPLRILIARALRASMRLLPGADGLLAAYLCQLELDADRAAVEGMDDASSLASALHLLLTAPAFVGLAVGALSATDVRIDRLLGAGTTPRALLQRPSGLHAVAFALVVGVVLCLLLAAIHGGTGIRPCLPC